MAQHTPGPWREFNDEDHDIIAADGGHVARIQEVNAIDPVGEQIANGLLIAAAPDLLAALRALLATADMDNLNQDRMDAVSDARAALAKAEG